MQYKHVRRYIHINEVTLAEFSFYSNHQCWWTES